MAAVYQPWDWLLPINSNVLPFGPDGIAFPFSNDYTWILACGIIFAFYAACGIGANDVANSFATSVGAGSLTLLQAVVIAGIFEFLGAVLLGASVTDTIKGGIVNPEDFVNTSDLLMMGMLTAIVGTAFWLTVATVHEMPVSTTHSVIGGILGFALCLPGVDIDWGSLGQIVASWFISPLLSGITSALFFYVIRRSILRNSNSFERILSAFPVIVWGVVTINLWFVIIKGGKQYKWSESLGGDWASLGVAAAIALGIAVIIRLFFIPRLRKSLESRVEEDEQVQDEVNQVDKEQGLQLQEDTPAAVDQKVGKQSRLAKWKEQNNNKLNEGRCEKVQSIHANAEKFEYRTELAFGQLQVFTACMMSFAHGANDVANAIGPLASIVSLYDTNGDVSSKAPVPEWILVLGGSGIVVGLAAYGYKVIRALGVKLIKVTPSRGSCIELATAFVIVLGSILGLPLSTTHTMVGASIGVGLLEGNKKAINLRLLAKILAGWVLTIIVAAAFSAALFSFVVYGPSVNRPIAPQNCLGQYGVTFSSQQNVTIQANTTVLSGDINSGAINF